MGNTLNRFLFRSKHFILRYWMYQGKQWGRVNGLLGNIQIEVLRRLQGEKAGVLMEELMRYWKYRDGAVKSIDSLQRLGHIRVVNNLAYFVSFPKGVEPEKEAAGYTVDQLKEFEEISRRNLVYLYKDELVKSLEGTKPRSIPEGVKRSLQRLGVLKWKILELTDLGRSLLSELLTPQMAGASVGA